MKYRTFRMLFVGVLSVVVVLSGVAIYKMVGERETNQRIAMLKALKAAKEERALDQQAEAAAKAKAAQASAAAPKAPVADKGLALRAVDRLLLAHLQRGFAGDRPKDAFPKEDYKVNIAKSKGEFRVKLDLNRDGHWDEKWTAALKDGVPEVKRQVAPADDESYTESYRLDGEGWRKK